MLFEKSLCRICGSNELASVLDLGNLALTGKFPKKTEGDVFAPVTLVKCTQCGLRQLAHKFDLQSLYGEGYGYESHLNSGMRNHLIDTARQLEKRFALQDGDSVLDIASNDGTLLSGYSTEGLALFGVDPLADSLSDLYPTKSIKIPRFFNHGISDIFEGRKFKMITSCSVFYDVDTPIDFAAEVEKLLTDDGVWFVEQSYYPDVIGTIGYDNICHEHAAYYRLKDILHVCDLAGLEVFDVSRNDTNGGSFCLYIRKKKSNSKRHSVSTRVLVMHNSEEILDANLDVDREFAAQVQRHKYDLLEVIDKMINFGRPLFGIGASTKGNVLLQVNGLTSDYLQSIGDINPRKFESVTPGTRIPICSEADLINNCPSDSLFLILPWHFSSGISEKWNLAMFELKKKGHLLIPLPSYPRQVSIG